MSRNRSVYLPIFPLPDLTFFPHTLLPLHIFEARYRAMVNDCLARDRRLAVVGLKPGYEADYEGRPAVHAVAGAGELVRCERLSSGRFNILLRGDCRVRIEREVPADTLYRMAQAEPLADVGGDRATVAPLIVALKKSCRRVLEAVDRSTERLEEALDAATPGVLTDQVASALVPSPAVRQRLLEETDVERRLVLLLSTLDDLLKQLNEER